MELRNTIVDIIAEALKIPRADINDEDKLADIAKDSIALFELLIQFEKSLGRHVQYEEIAHIETVGDIIIYASALPGNPFVPTTFAPTRA